MSAAPQPLGALIERALNRLLADTPGASAELARHAGARVRFALGLFDLDTRIADDGLFSEAAFDTPDATLAPTATLLVRLPFFGRAALRDARFEGEPALLATLDRVFRRVNPDLAALLAPYLGDIAAVRAAALAHDAQTGARNAASAVGVNLAEYLVEEIELLARRVDVERFNREVDAFADAVARLEVRMQRLQA